MENIKPFILNRQNNLDLQKELSLDCVKVDYISTMSELMMTYNTPVVLQAELGQRLFRLINLVIIHNLFIYIAENRLRDYVTDLDQGNIGRNIHVSYYYLGPVMELLTDNVEYGQEENIDYLVQVVTNYLSRTLENERDRYYIVIHKIFEELLNTFHNYPIGSFKLEILGDASPVIFLSTPTEGFYNVKDNQIHRAGLPGGS